MNAGLVKIGDRDDWRIDFARYGGPYIVECGLTDANPEVGNTIAQVMVSYGADGRDRDFATTQKRCYVLAAAPMMLAALRRAETQLRCLMPDDVTERDNVALKEIRAAIAKATVPA